jgi:tRNA-modifying protein YgfZ
MTGYQALREHAAWIDLAARGRIFATGEDRARLLHAMTTNHVQQLQPGQGLYAFFLNAQGRILGDVNVLCLPDRFLLDTEPEVRRKLYEHLDRYIIADDVTLEDASDLLTAVSLEGPASAEVLEAIGAPRPASECGVAEWDGVIVANLNTTGSPGCFLIAPLERRAELISQLEAAGAVAATADEARVVRIENARPRYGEEITERFLVQETQQMHAVHFSKGCYLGQEIVERVRSRAHIHRMLMPLEIEGADVPQPGVKLQFEGQDRGDLVSATWSPALGKVVGMAYLRVELDLAGRKATVRPMPPRTAPC